MNNQLLFKTPKQLAKECENYKSNLKTNLIFNPIQNKKTLSSKNSNFQKSIQSQFNKIKNDFELMKDFMKYSHKNNLLTCGMMLGNMNTGAYRGGSAFDYEDDFSSDKGWTFTGSGNSISGGKLNFDLERKASHEGSWIATGDADVFGVGQQFSDTVWEMRWHGVNYSTIDAANNQLSPYLSATDNGGIDVESSNDLLSAIFDTAGTFGLSAQSSDGGTRATLSAVTYAWTTGVDYFILTKRTSSTLLKVSASSTDAFTEDLVSLSSLAIPSSVINLDNIQVGNDHAGSTTGRTNVGTIDKLQALKDSNS